ncbi:phosphodiester glycosidase family protein [Dethiosulfatarculus sandiegensis]|uniref:Phosphodiester glycosidase domain-containing protein n=1 Tax=Dethiosulfatarculus sandiegensis TaxID=1429043 RepID=A0A0D2K0C5_9BACT|nr:phosphodiester glycosidase family protein [Dethiosulfatarculus sandiegensis]KIX15195.1 hypothetical protein X474_04750 [Dethiosulfatarculus sandiegensis]
MGSKLKKNFLILPIAAWLAFSPGSALAKPDLSWQILRPGLSLSVIQASDTARTGSEDVILLKINPQVLGFRVLAAPNGERGYDAGDWRKKTGALAVVNAGLFTPEKNYLGLLIKDGRRLSRLASRPAGLFVAEPDDPSLPKARVLDMQYTALDIEHLPYRQAAQSIMLLDRFGNIRVRRTAHVANRTALAEDSSGNILVIITKGEHTLWEFADYLAKSGLDIREVMCMDGGPEAQLDLKVGDYTLTQYGSPSGSMGLPWPSAALPVALGIFAPPPKKPVQSFRGR